MNRVAVVTGANRGIGFYIAKHLAQEFDGTVILTARNREQGEAARGRLVNQCSNIESHQLDISCGKSIHTLKEYLSTKYGGLDILINNAGILIPSSTGKSFAEKAELCVKTNFFDTLAVCDALFPLLRDNSRVVNVTSSMGSLKMLGSFLQKRFVSQSLNREELIELMKKFLRDVKTGKAKDNGWPSEDSNYNPAYSMSKFGLTVLTSILSKELENDSRKNILINSVCPGWCQTDMGGSHAPRTPQEGAKTPVYLAMLPSQVTTPNGQMLYIDNEIVQWKQSK